MKIRELLTDSSKWMKKRLVTDAGGRLLVSAQHPDAAVWCLVGAARHCYGEIRTSANPEMWCASEACLDVLDRLSKDLGFTFRGNLTFWNDNPERTFEDVKALVERLDL